MQSKVKDTLNLLKEKNYLRQDLLSIFNEAASKFADWYNEEDKIADELYNKLIGE